MLDNYVFAEGQKRCLGCMGLYDRNYEVCPHCGYTEVQTGISLLHLSPGTILKERYLIGRSLGYGGFGVTYIAFDNKLQRRVAIKEYLPSEYATRHYRDPNVIVEDNEKRAQQFKAGKDRFLEEGKRLAEVGNIDNVVHMYECFEANSTAYIVMELLEGMTLAEYLNNKGTLSQEEMLDIMLPLMGSLSQVHEIGIIHRDISPENIFLTKDKDGKIAAKLIDFGSAKYAMVARSSKSLTVLVNKGYSPEEQYRSKGSQGSYTDVYALSAVMYKMLTGVRPPDALERRASIENRKPDRLQPVSKYNKNVSENVENAILNGMNVKVEDRSATIEELVGELISFERVKRRGTTIGFLDPLSWPLWAKITVPLVSIFAVIMLVYSINRIFTNPNFMVSLPDGMTRVPEFISAHIDDAVKKGEKAMLLVRSVNDEYVPGGKSEIVLTQDMAYGIVVPENQMVSVTVSTNKQEYPVPDVVGMQEDYARYALESMGLEVLVEEGTQKGLASGCVIEQSIEPFAIVDAGETITLKITTTDRKAVSDNSLNVEGIGYEEALGKADSKGAQCTVKEKVFDKKRKDGEILKADYNAEGILELTVALSYREFEMPNLKYKNQDIAIQLLRNIGAEAEVEAEYCDSIANDLVFEQSVKAGREVSPGDLIQLKVSMGSKPFSMPSVIKMKQEEAEEILKSLKLAVSVEYDYSTDIEPGCVISQSVDAGTDARIGDAVTIYVCTKDVTRDVSDVVGKDSSEAKGTLEKQGFVVQIVETYSEVVEKGKIIQQLPEPNSKQKIGTVIVLTVSKGASEKKPGNSSPTPTVVNGETSRTGSSAGNQNANGVTASNPTNDENSSSSNGSNSSSNHNSEKNGWSEWVTSLPSGVSANSYEIEQSVQYRSRTRENTTSTSSSMPGWTLYDQKEAWGDYGPWSDWSTTSKSSSDSTQVQSKTQYRYKTRETTTSTSSSLSGWTRYDQGETWGDYGPWSEWSTNEVSASDATKVETDIQSRKRDKEKATWHRLQDIPQGQGWVEDGITTEYGSWGEWTQWGFAIRESEVDHETMDVEYETQYGYIYGHYKCLFCKACDSTEHSICPNCNNSTPWGYEEKVLYGNYGTYDKYQGNYCEYFDGEPYYYQNIATVESRSRIRNIYKNYNYYRWGQWSSWGEVGWLYVSSDDTQVEKRQVYRYCTKTRVPLYYYERYTNWSNWQDENNQGSDQVFETRTLYRYRTRNKVYSYYYMRYTNWSSYGFDSVTASDTVDVQTRVVYRYKQK